MTVHLVKGRDPILRHEAVDPLVREVLGDDDRTLALEDFEIPGRGRRRRAEGTATTTPTGTPFEAALNAARTPPFMTARRVVVVREIGQPHQGRGRSRSAVRRDPVDTTEPGARRGARATESRDAHSARSSPVTARPSTARRRRPTCWIRAALTGSASARRASACSPTSAKDAGLLPGARSTRWPPVHGPGAQLGRRRRALPRGGRRGPGVGPHERDREGGRGRRARGARTAPHVDEPEPTEADAPAPGARRCCTATTGGCCPPRRPGDPRTTRTRWPHSAGARAPQARGVPAAPRPGPSGPTACVRRSTTWRADLDLKGSGRSPATWCSRSWCPARRRSRHPGR